MTHVVILKNDAVLGGRGLNPGQYGGCRRGPEQAAPERAATGTAVDYSHRR